MKMISPRSAHNCGAAGFAALSAPSTSTLPCVIATRARMLAIAALAFAGTAWAQQLTIIQPGIGDTTSAASAISADGTTVVGVSSRPVPFRSQGFRQLWQQTTVSTILPPLAAAQNTVATGVSCDGSVIIGQSGTTSQPQAVKWANGQTFPMGFLSSASNRTSLAKAVSCDGQTIVGQASNSTNDLEAFRSASTTAAPGPLQGLGFISPSSNNESSANGVSSTGIIIGRSSRSTAGSSVASFEAVSWAPPAGPYQSLGQPFGYGQDDTATAITPDGSVIVGSITFNSFSFVPFRATRTQSGVISSFDALVPCDEGSGSATAVSADGRIVVGFDDCTGPNRAFVWDPVNGYRLVQDILAAAGTLPAGFTMTIATGISADGTTIVGNGTATGFIPRAWVAVIPRTDVEPCPACPADYNQDGGITGDDIAAFFADFESGGGCSDTNLDGGITGDDIGAFFSAFEAGGC